MDQFGHVLAQIAQQLGITASLLWPQLVAVTFYESLVWAIVDPLIVIAATIAACRLFPQCLKKSQWDEADEIFAVFGLIFGGIGYVVLIALVVTSYPDVIAGVFAPQGMTAVHLLQQLSRK